MARSQITVFRSFQHQNNILLLFRAHGSSEVNVRISEISKQLLLQAFEGTDYHVGIER